MADSKKQREDFVREWHERRAAERAAWGAWAGYVRQQNFNMELASLPKEEKAAFLENARNENIYGGFFVG